MVQKIPWGSRGHPWRSASPVPDMGAKLVRRIFPEAEGGLPGAPGTDVGAAGTAFL